MAPKPYQHRERSLKSAARLRLRQLDAERDALLHAFPELRAERHYEPAPPVGLYSRRADSRATRGR